MRAPGKALVAAACVVAAPAGAAHAAAPGMLDGSYGNCGVLTPPKAAAEATPAGAAPVAGGGLIAVGTDSDKLVTVKLGGDGQIETAYGSAGVATVKLGGFTKPSYRFTAVAAQPGGRVVAAGSAGEQNSGTTQAALARVNADGSLDATFGTGGVVTGALPGGRQSSIADIDVDPSGRILVVGSRDDAFVVARFTPDGAPDPAFGSAGVVQVALPGFKRGSGNAIRAVPGGGAVAGGQADEQFALIRLRDDGSPDPAFGSGGATFDSPPASASVDSLAILPDGKVAAGGEGDDINGFHQVVARYSADGRVDASFGRGGFAQAENVGTAAQLLPQPDGSLLTAGQGFARYTAAGALDQTFGDHGVLPGSPTGPLVPQPDGSAIGVSGRRTQMAFERYAFADPALAALAGQSSLCGLRIKTGRVKQLVRSREEGRFGGLDVTVSVLQPTIAHWKVTARAGGRSFVLRARSTFDGAFPDDIVIPLTKRVQAQLSRARRVQITVTGGDTAAHSVTATRTLTP